MKILYNDEGYLRDEVDWLLCSDGIINVNKLEFFAKNKSYDPGGDYISIFTYDEEDILEIEQEGISLPRSEGKVYLIIWDHPIYHDEIITVVLYDADVFYQYLKQVSLRSALIHPFQLKRIITCLAKIKHDLKLDQ